MKKGVFSVICSGLLSLWITGCASTAPAPAAPAAPAITDLKCPALGSVAVNVVVTDKRPTEVIVRYGTSSWERPEAFFYNTLNPAVYTMNFLNRGRWFKQVTANPKTPAGVYTLQLTWLSARVNLNSWIPFVLRVQNNMQMELCLRNPSGKALWTYNLTGQAVNTPSSFRWGRAVRCDIFQERIMERELSVAAANMIAAINANPGCLKK